MVDQRFPRAVRLRKRPDFKRVQRSRHRLNTKSFIVCWSRGPGPEGERYGLTVSRKVGGAVTRNRVKRWLREAIRRNRGHVEGLDVVFIARGSAADADFESVEEQVALAFRRIARREGR